MMDVASVLQLNMLEDAHPELDRKFHGDDGRLTEANSSR